MTRDQLLQHIDHSDSLLQSYRGIFLTSQSVLFSIGVFVAASTSDQKEYLVLLSLVGFVQLAMWHAITEQKGHFVWFFQWKLLLHENNKYDDGKPLDEVLEWIRKSSEQRIADLKKCEYGNRLLGEEFGFDSVFSSVVSIRRLLNLWLPILFAILWVVLLVKQLF